MRTTLFSVVFVFALLSGIPAVVPAGAAPVTAVEIQEPPQPPSAELKVDIDTDGDGAWYAQPIWIIAGVAGLAVLIALIALASRGGGTTIVKE